ncbi:DUF4870 family protein [Corallincola platygyrae]|uniref:DUF4870 family protein n=1 Tax=Corallincola platygyrae TaxID=1193278 RepID=A0ABW4XM02_9GAMM
MSEVITPPEQNQEDLTIGHVVYGLFAASFLIGITGLVGVIIAHVKRGDVAADSVLASHFRWQIRTFWFGFLWGVLGVILTFVYIGILVLLANAVWFIYRIVRGWINLNDKKPMYV